MGIFNKIKEKFEQRKQQKLQQQKEKELLEKAKKEYMDILNEIVCNKNYSDEAKVNDLIEKLPQKFFEKETQNIVQGCVQKIARKDLIAEEEFQHIKKIMDIFGVSCKDFYVLQAKYTLWRHENTDELPELESENIMLKKEEKLYFEYPAVLCKYVKHTERVNFHGPVLNLKIVGGLKYRVGSFGLGKTTSTSLEKIDSGRFFITNKRVAFVGDLKNFSYSIEKIMKYGVTDDGLLIQKENLLNPQIVELGNYEAALAVFSDMMKKL